MNLLKNIFARVAVAVAVLFNRYEGGQRWNPGRSYLQGWVQDARFDASAAERTELVRKSRIFERNNAIVNRLADLYEQFTVGAEGLSFIPSSSDEKWNQNAKLSWEEWCQVCDLQSLHPFSTLQTLGARTQFIDGEFFILLTRGDSKGGSANLAPTLKPRIQLIESHRVATPANHQQREGHSIVDGIEIDPRGRPVGYWIRQGIEDTDFKFYAAEFVIHVGEPSRIGMYRPLPFLYPVMNDLHDLDDLSLLEMQAAKEAAAITNVVKNVAGELPGTNLRRQAFSQATQTSANAETTETRVQQFRQVLGARMVALKAGEDMEQFSSTRPTITTQQYWDYLTSKVCAGVGISKLLVLPYTIQGTVARADFDIANAFFRSRSAVLAAAFTRVYLFYMEWAVGNDRRLADKPGDWRSVETRAPRSVNVDVGRNSQTMLSELKAGTRTFQSVYAELGMDWREQLRQKAKEAQFIKRLAVEFEVTPGEISDTVIEGIQAEADATATAQPQPQPQQQEAA
jgi:lambda family phage portal protein